MNKEELDAHSFLTELYNQTEGDTAKQVSMYDVGTVLGFDKGVAGAVAEDLIVDGYAELVSLSGGICITPAGLKELNVEFGDSQTDGIDRLGEERVLTSSDRQAIEELLVTVRNSVAGQGGSFEYLEQIVIDIKTIEVQLLSPQAKTEIIREILKSLHESIRATENHTISDHIHKLVGN